jgi:hypothetical protein
MSAGVVDGYFSPASTTAMAIALGVPLAGDAAEPVLPSRLGLAGRRAVSFPVARNLEGLTAAVLSYAAPFTNGHYVLFDQEAARAQYTCFLATLGGERGPVIPAPQNLEAPCPGD